MRISRLRSVSSNPAAVRGRWRVLRPGYGGNFEMAKLNEMLGGQLGAAPVVDDHGIHIQQARFAIQIDQQSPGFLERAQEIQVRSVEQLMIPDTFRLRRSRRAASSLRQSSSALQIKTVYPLALASSSIALTRAAQRNSGYPR